MPAPLGRRRALLAGRDAPAALAVLFAAPPLCDRWETVAADDAGHARTLLRHNLFDAVVLPAEGGANLDDWTAGLSEGAPLVQLLDCRPDVFTRAYRDGVALCLPRDLTLRHPPLLEAALDQAARLADARRLHAITRGELEQCRRHIDRLVSLIWRSTPIEPGSGWLAERYLVDRLEEELARSQRHGTPFTLAVGEIQADEPSPSQTPPGSRDISEWTARTVGRAKRRCDLAGQYGPNRFLLLMVHTPKAGAVTCCRRLQHLLQNDPPPGLPGERVRACFGLAGAPALAAFAPALLRAAEENLDAARASREGIAV